MTAISIVLAGWSTGAAARSQIGGEDKTCADTANAEAAIAACTRLYDNRGLGKRNRAIALGNRGAAYKMLGKYSEAIADFDLASELDPDNPQYYCQRGDIHIRLGQLDTAIEDFTTALRYSPRLLWGFQGRGRAYFAKGNGEQALADFNEALRLKPGDFILLTQRGRASNLAEKYDVAVADLSKAMKHPKFDTILPKERADLIAQRGYAYIKQGRASEARSDADEALRLMPKSALALGVTGLIEEKEGAREKAKDAFKRALAIEPGLKLAKAGLDRVGGEDAAESQKAAEGPEKASEPVAQSDPIERTTPRSDPQESQSGVEMCAKYIPEIGRTVRVECAD